MWSKLKLIILTVAPTAIICAFWFFRDKGKKRKLKNRDDDDDDDVAESQSQQSLPKIEVTDVDMKSPTEIFTINSLLPVTEITKTNSDLEGTTYGVGLKMQCEVDNPPNIVETSRSVVLKEEVPNLEAFSHIDVGNSDVQTRAVTANDTVKVDVLKNSETEIGNAVVNKSVVQNYTVTDDLDIDRNIRDGCPDYDKAQTGVTEKLSLSRDAINEFFAETIDSRNFPMDNHLAEHGIDCSESRLANGQNVIEKDCNVLELSESADFQSRASVVESVSVNNVEQTNVHNSEENFLAPDEQFSLPVTENEKENEHCIMDPDVKNSCIYQFDFPSSLCGRLIGRYGHNINQIKETSGAKITVVTKPYTADYQMIVLEGTEDQVSSALKLIKAKFPEGKFPGVDYSPSLPESLAPPVENMIAPVSQNISQLMLPTGVNSDVIVSRVVSANHIFVQQLTHPSFPHLERQMQMMMQCYDSVDETPGLPKPYEVGTVCVTRIDSYWYRVQIVGASLDSDVCDVKLVDYGGYVQVQDSDLKLIRRDFTMLPFQAIECYLYGVISPSDEEDFPAEASSILTELVSGAILQVQAVAVEEDQVPYVLLAKPVGNQSLDINRELVNRGVARWYEL